VDSQPGAAGIDRVMEIAVPPVLFPELRKGNRRRVLFNPATKLVDATIVSHGVNLTLVDGNGQRCSPGLPGFIGHYQDHNVCT